MWRRIDDWIKQKSKLWEAAAIAAAALLDNPDRDIRRILSRSIKSSRNYVRMAVVWAAQQLQVDSVTCDVLFEGLVDHDADVRHVALELWDQDRTPRNRREDEFYKQLVPRLASVITDYAADLHWRINAIEVLRFVGYYKNDPILDLMRVARQRSYPELRDAAKVQLHQIDRELFKAPRSGNSPPT